MSLGRKHVQNYMFTCNVMSPKGSRNSNIRWLLTHMSYNMIMSIWSFLNVIDICNRDNNVIWYKHCIPILWFSVVFYLLKYAIDILVATFENGLFCLHCHHGTCGKMCSKGRQKKKEKRSRFLSLYLTAPTW